MAHRPDDQDPNPPRQAIGRVPPHDLQAEESLLGAMMLTAEAIAAAAGVVTSSDFYKPAHGHVYDAIHTLYAAGQPADAVTVADELRRAGLLEAIGGHAVLAQIMSSTPATTNAGRYARIVEEYALLRRLIGVAGEIAELGYSVPDDVSKALDRAESLIFEVNERRVTDSTRLLSTLLVREPRPDRAAPRAGDWPSPARPPATSTSTRCWPACNRAPWWSSAPGPRWARRRSRSACSPTPRWNRSTRRRSSSSRSR